MKARCRELSSNVTPFTDAIVQRARGLEDLQVASGGFALSRIAKASEGWTDMSRVQIAHDEVRRTLNDQLPGIYRIEDLTRLPVILNLENDRPSSAVLTNNQNGIYGAVVGGFARLASGESIRSANEPAYRKAEQFSRDISDGRLDHLAGTTPLSESRADQAYEFDQLWLGTTLGAGRTSSQSGEASLASKRGIVAFSRTSVQQATRSILHSTTGRLTIVDLCGSGQPVPGSQTANAAWRADRKSVRASRMASASVGRSTSLGLSSVMVSSKEDSRSQLLIADHARAFKCRDCRLIDA